MKLDLGDIGWVNCEVDYHKESAEQGGMVTGDYYYEVESITVDDLINAEDLDYAERYIEDNFELLSDYIKEKL